MVISRPSPSVPGITCRSETRPGRCSPSARSIRACGHMTAAHLPAQQPGHPRPAIVNQTAEPARRIDLNVSASYDDADGHPSAPCSRRPRPRMRRSSKTGPSRPRHRLRDSAVNPCALGPARRITGPATMTSSTACRQPFLCGDHHDVSAYQCSYGIIKKEYPYIVYHFCA